MLFTWAHALQQDREWLSVSSTLGGRRGILHDDCRLSQTDGWTHVLSVFLLSLSLSHSLSLSQAVWVGSNPREKLGRWKKPISALTFASVLLSWHTAGGHGGSLADSHIDYRKRRGGGRIPLLTLKDGGMEGRMDEGRMDGRRIDGLLVIKLNGSGQ